MLEQLLQDIQALGHLDWIVTITALVYVVLSARNNPWCWLFGIVSCALWAYLSFFSYHLYLDALLQLFYVGMGFWGLYSWLRGGGEGKGLAITPTSGKEHLLLITVGVASGLILGYGFSYTAAAATYWDALTTTFSVLATILLVRRRLANWLYWIVIDGAYVGLYFSRGATLLGVLMLVYTVIAIFAYLEWSRQMQASQT